MRAPSARRDTYPDVRVRVEHLLPAGHVDDYRRGDPVGEDVPTSPICSSRPPAAGPRGPDRAGHLPGAVRGLLGAADHRADDPGSPAQPADLDPELLRHPRPALVGPRLPAGGHRVRSGAGAAGALPAQPHRSAGHPPDRLRPDPTGLRRLVRHGHRRLHRDPRPRALSGGQGARAQHPGAGLGPHRPLVDHPGAGAGGRAERRAGRGGDDRLPVHPPRSAAAGGSRRSSSPAPWSAGPTTSTRAGVGSPAT